MAVFRFTLGIPGFDDSNIPRVVGAVVAALVALNHVLGADPAPPAQVQHPTHSLWLCGVSQLSVACNTSAHLPHVCQYRLSKLSLAPPRPVLPLFVKKQLAPG